VDVRTLWGVFGTESGFGKNLGPSSAGARGPMQFLLSTARMFGVNPTDSNWTDDFNGAARYLKQLGADGDINSAATAQALNRYSGGGGTGYIKKVRDNGHTWGTGPDVAGAVAGAAAGAVGDAAGAVGGAVSAVPDFLGKLGVIFQANFWLRVALGLGGLLMIGFAIVTIGKQYAPKNLPPIPIPV
jgi:hypothetical protein